MILADLDLHLTPSDYLCIEVAMNTYGAGTYFRDPINPDNYLEQKVGIVTNCLEILFRKGDFCFRDIAANAIQKIKNAKLEEKPPAEIIDNIKEPVCHIPNNDIFIFYCPGCKQPHCIETPNGTNKDIYAPTVNGPSNIVRPDGRLLSQGCHFFIVAGYILYWPDSRCFADKICKMAPVKKWQLQEPAKLMYGSSVTCMGEFLSDNRQQVLQRILRAQEAHKNYPLDLR